MNQKKLVIGILAHVDAGKTTLAESILYGCKAIRKLGRVDHKDAFLDTYALEKARGITIFSKQALFQLGDVSVTLLDTPGHVDFSAEMERTLSVLDYAVLVISGTDGVQGHVPTLWKLLKRYHVPVFLFINKMDQAGTNRGLLMEELQNRLDARCIEFDEKKRNEAFEESLAVCDDALLERYLEGEPLTDADIAGLIRERKVFPCYFGSALRMTGVEEFLRGLGQYTICPEYPDEFAARVFKISRDAQGNRLTHLKVTGEVLRVKQPIGNGEEKADQIRVYNGGQFRIERELAAGSVCAVSGPLQTFAGEGLGAEPQAASPVLEPVLTYRVELAPGSDVHGMYRKLCTLEEEEPQLHIVWEEETGEIHAQVMGAVQMEILKSMVKERFGADISFGTGQIVYKETITKAAEGVGHFEPLRHYAEVHLLLEPGERGSGLVFDTVCSEDVLDRNWQRLVLTHLEEKVHRGVLTGSPITDMKITLLTGRAHVKHTEGGDFRQATYRAVRQGLKETESILLEPVLEFSLEVPADAVGRAMTDLQRMQASFSQPTQEKDTARITGSVPAATLGDYQRELMAYTRGEGRLFCSLKGYEPCHNAEAVIAQIGYDSERDLKNPTGSVFCSHGAGFPVPWDEVKQYMHLEAAWHPAAPGSTGSGSTGSGGSIGSGSEEAASQALAQAGRAAAAGKAARTRSSLEEDKELEEIFTRTYGPVSRPRTAFDRRPEAVKPKKQETEEPAAEYLLVDGYNIIFSWDELNELAKIDMGAARLALMDILSNYQGFKGCVLILVFDAYKVEGYQGEVQKYHNIYVVYTKEAETADQYIEKTVLRIERRRRVTVATSDGIEQLIIMGQGALRLSAKGLREEVETATRQLHREFLNRPQGMRSYLFQNVPKELMEKLEQMRLGNDKK